VDLNRLYFDHQLSMIRAARSPTCDLRRGHTLHASQIAGRIGYAQRALGATAAPAWESLARPPFASDCEAKAGLRSFS
jgi:hypothetical protein